MNTNNNSATVEKNQNTNNVQEKQEKKYVYVPRVTIERNNEKVTLHLELPAVKKDQIDVNLEKNLLTISANATAGIELKQEDIIMQEFAPRSFKRVFELTDEVDTDSISADYKDGVLKLSLLLRKPIAKKITLK